jgi:hypothetical protein
MIRAVRENAVGRKKTTNVETTTTKIAVDLVFKAKLVAAAAKEPKLTLFDLLDGILRPEVERRFAEMVRGMADEVDTPKRRKKE